MRGNEFDSYPNDARYPVEEAVDASREAQT
jgi:hypothetical protein